LIERKKKREGGKKICIPFYGRKNLVKLFADVLEEKNYYFGIVIYL
jgi:hypothetical protein